MSLFHSDSKRRIIPRWRASGAAAQSTEFQSLTRPREVITDIGTELDEIYQAFKLAPSVGRASEVLSASMIAGDHQKAGEAARLIIQSGGDVPAPLLQLAQDIRNGKSPILTGLEPEEGHVKEVRELLRINPRNPMLWSDMARHHAGLGNKEAANRCMAVALGLAPDHRWMLRSAARFYLHENSKERAHKLLVNHPLTKRDPWLIAAEIACASSAGRSPKFWSQAKHLAEHGGIHPRHMSELHAAMAMLELEGGAAKKARKMLERGMTAPTENTLAQVCWTIENKHLGETSTLESMVIKAEAPNAYEAECRMAMSEAYLTDAMQHANRWAADEPFAARPRIEKAFIASLMDDCDHTIKMIDDVERIDGKIDFSLEMNRIYALINSNKLDAMGAEVLRQKLASLLNEKTVAYHALANLGLWHYRYGDKSEGRRYYRESIDSARLHSGPDSMAMASIFAAREAVLAADEDAEEALQATRKIVDKFGNQICHFYLRKVEAASVAPEDADKIFSPASVQRFLPVKPVVYRFENRKDGPVLIVTKPFSSQTKKPT